MNKIIVVFFCVFQSCYVFCQTSDSTKLFFNEFNFITHLAQNKLFTEAEVVTQELFKLQNLPALYKDSVNFYLGLEYYKEKKLTEARTHFVEVSDQVFFYYKARYLAGIISAEANLPDSAIAVYSSILESTNVNLNELKQFEISGTYLLNKKTTVFDSISKTLSFTNPIINEEFQNLKRYSEIQKKIKRKSAFVAGSLSAIIPGLGKVYSGNNGQALASFLTCALLGSVAVENYIHLGYQHPQTIFFTGVFGAFYIGNIWGSALSVQLVKTEKQFENKHNILVGLKVPIDKFFN